ncbi:hypothetical protein AMTRI_Chr12g237830 [Amborella trichopoda]
MSEASENENTLESQVVPIGPTPQRKLKSKVWEDFTLEIKQDGTRNAICKHCNRTFVAKMSDGTTHLLHHIKGCLSHPHQDLHLSLAGELETFKLLLGENHFHMRCCAHILNIIVQAGLKVIHSVKASPSRMQIFNEIAQQLRVPSKKGLVLDILTRWNSTFDMLQSTLTYKEYRGSECNLTRAIVTILDPRYKLKFIEYYFVTGYGVGDESEVKYKIVRDNLYVASSSGSSSSLVDRGTKRLHLNFNQFLDQTSVSFPKKSDMDHYLEHELVPQDEDVTFDFLCWWKLITSMYPILSELARDILENEILHHHHFSLFPIN